MWRDKKRAPVKPRYADHPFLIQWPGTPERKYNDWKSERAQAKANAEWRKKDKAWEALPKEERERRKRVRIDEWRAWKARRAAAAEEAADPEAGAQEDPEAAAQENQ